MIELIEIFESIDLYGEGAWADITDDEGEHYTVALRAPAVSDDDE